jgi:membrane fusion protein (multidrug efflux system)
MSENIANTSSSGGANAGNRKIKIVVTVLIVIAAAVYSVHWMHYRFTHSITDNAFVESDLVNVAPLVAGHLKSLEVDDGDAVANGQLLAVIDETDYRKQVELYEAKLAVAKTANQRAITAADRLEKEINQKIALAENDVQIAKENHLKAKKNLELVTRNVEETINAARDAVHAAEAAVERLKQDYDRACGLYKEQSIPKSQMDAATMAWKTARARLEIAKAKFAQATAGKNQIHIAENDVQLATLTAEKADKGLKLAKLETLAVKEAKDMVNYSAAEIGSARRGLEIAQTNLDHTRLTAPFKGVVAKKFLNPGDFVSPGFPVVSLYDPENLYITANVEETKLEGVHVGSPVDLSFDAFSKRLKGTVIKIGKATGSKFALIPRDNSSGEFTKVVQRIPIKIAIEKNESWPQLKPGLSVTVAIEHEKGN